MGGKKTNRIGKFAMHEIVYGGHLQALGASGIVYISSYFLSEKIGLELLIFVYFIFQFIYLNDRYKNITIDRATNQKRTEHFNSYYNKIPYVLIFLGTSGLIGILIYSGFQSGQY